MNLLQWSKIQRLIGYLEGIAEGIDGGKGKCLMDGIADLSAVINELCPDELKEAESV